MLSKAGRDATNGVETMGQMQKLGERSTCVYPIEDEHGKGYAVRYHSTDVVKVWYNGRIVLNHGGWMSLTTKTRMNQASNQFGLGFHVRQQDFTWYVDIDGHVMEFEGKELLLRNGHD